MVISWVTRPEMHSILQNPEKFKSRMHSLAYGGAMAAAARDYQQVHTFPNVSTVQQLPSAEILETSKKAPS